MWFTISCHDSNHNRDCSVWDTRWNRRVLYEPRQTFFLRGRSWDKCKSWTLKLVVCKRLLTTFKWLELYSSLIKLSRKWSIVNPVLRNGGTLACVLKHSFLSENYWIVQHLGKITVRKRRNCYGLQTIPNLLNRM